MRKLYNLIIANKQRQANVEVAKLLHNSEYRNESFAYVLDLVENGLVCSAHRV